MLPQNPDLPALIWNDCWDGEIVLASWAGFQTRRRSQQPATGSVSLMFDTDGAGRVPPTAAQIHAYRWLLDHEAEIAATVLNAIFAEYPQFRADYLDAYEEGDPEAEASVPVHSHPEQLRKMMELVHVIILPLCRDEVGYVGFQFKCDWEEEHGVGVLTHMNRIVEIGQADTAFDGNRAEEDAYD